MALEMIYPFIYWLGQFRFKSLRRRLVEQTLNRWGMSRRRALSIARHIP